MPLPHASLYDQRTEVLLVCFATGAWSRRRKTREIVLMMHPIHLRAVNNPFSVITLISCDVASKRSPTTTFGFKMFEVGGKNALF